MVGAVGCRHSVADHDHDHDHDRGRAYRQHVVISGVQYDSLGRDNRSNRGVDAVDEDGHTYTFHHYRLEGRSTVRVHTGEGRDSHTDLYQDRCRYVWNNDHDTATLRNDRGRFVDDYSWGRDHRDRRGRDRHDARH
ncbi:lamin tail domain-containing protein [Streptomyces sp. NPDC020299]|uniref:lamin tail domain-containing protein n=1 Tax=Streptomyces sp. NPDC020299 TaxID=3365067 RepID=UPI00379CB5D0